ncbi:MAG: hypothetical protein ABW278_14755, partial [Steroidobacteraceae bacterium]
MLKLLPQEILRVLMAVLLMVCTACAATRRPAVMPPVPEVARPAPPAPQPHAALEASCKAMEPSYKWQRSAPPAASTRMLYTVPAGAKAQLWFLGRNRAVALCTPCSASLAAVQSFEWYEPGFTRGEL